MVARLGAAPSVSSSQARRVAVSLARVETGGLCGHCSRDLPLDRRLLFVAELTGHEWWVVSVTLRRWSGWTSALQAARDLYAATNPKWLRDVESHHDRRAYETPRVLNLPAIRWKWHGVPVLPRTRVVLETALRRLAPAVWI